MRIIITETQLNKLINKNLLNEGSIDDFDVSTFLNRKYIKDYINADNYEVYYLAQEFIREYDLDENDIDEIFKHKEFIQIIEDILYEKVYKIIDTISYEINNGKIKIYRAITVDDNWLEHIKKEGKRLGIYWAWDYDFADTHWGDPSKPNLLIIEAEIDEKYIDWYGTIDINVNFDMAEKEIRLFKNTPIKITSLELNDEELDISEIKDKIFQA